MSNLCIPAMKTSREVKWDKGKKKKNNTSSRRNAQKELHHFKSHWSNDCISIGLNIVQEIWPVKIPPSILSTTHPFDKLYVCTYLTFEEQNAFDQHQKTILVSYLFLTYSL
uniref:Uncharacterized protein n=1 Tax=Cacopsylla melanoneura TaxID=428564 RepID=A0A8D8UUT5_9HEMI